MSTPQDTLFKQCRVGDIAKVISGFAFKSHSFQADGVPVIKIKNIRIGSVDLSESDRVDPSFLSLDQKYHVKGGDLLISLTGSHLTQPNSVVGRVAAYPSTVEQALLNQRAGKITITRPDRCDPRYLFYSLSATEVRRNIALMASGAASQANVSPSQVESVQILLPPLPTQRKIASILSAYDDLIENNTRRIEILEEMAQAIYREWFVNFRFPGHEKVGMVDSPLGLIPEGWEIRTLADMCTVVMGQSPKSEYYNDKGEGLPFHQGVKDFGPRFPTDRLYCTVQNRVAEAGDILFSVRAPVGRINLTTKKIVIGRGLCAIRCKSGNQVFTFQQLKDRFQEEDSMGGGTIFKAVTKGDMLGIKLIQPEDSLAKRFESLIEPVFKEIENLTAKNSILRRTRDLLLPKLISGEVDVEELSNETIGGKA
jgi:type I restriction enzyme S subunit